MKTKKTDRRLAGLANQVMRRTVMSYGALERYDCLRRDGQTGKKTQKNHMSSDGEAESARSSMAGVVISEGDFSSSTDRP